MSIETIVSGFQASYTTELWKHGGYKQIISRNLTEPCKDPLIKTVVKIAISADSKCFVKKVKHNKSTKIVFTLLINSIFRGIIVFQK